MLEDRQEGGRARGFAGSYKAGGAGQTFQSVQEGKGLTGHGSDDRAST